MEGKVIKEESVGSPCSPLALPPSGKENRRVTSPHNPSEILTRSRTKVLSKENSHHHHHSHRMSESPKGSSGSPSPPVSSINLSNKGVGGGSSSTPHGFLHHHQFSSPHANASSSNSAGSGLLNGSASRKSPSPPPPTSSVVNGRDRERGGSDGSSSNTSSGSNARTPTSSSGTGSNNSSASSNSLGGSGGNSRLLVKIKRFLGTLLHFGCDISPDVGERVRTLVFSLVSGHLSIEEFHHTLQEVTSFPLRPFVLPFLRAHLPLLQREINHAARLAKQSTLSYIQTHEQVIVDTASSPGEPCDIFHSEASDLTLPAKRKASDSLYENGDISSESSSGYVSTPKRHHSSGSIFSPPFFLGSGGSMSAEFREYYAAAASGYMTIPSQHHSGSGSAGHHGHEGGGMTPNTPATTPSNGAHGSSGGKGGPEDEWKNIHVMLNCILSMVEKTKRALTILQTRTAAQTEQAESGASSASWLRRPSIYSAMENSEDLKRQVGEMMAQAFRATEDRVSEVKRRAEEAVQEVKRQALVELKRAVAAAEARACEAVASERARLERALMDSRRNPAGDMVNPLLGASTVDSEACWNCGRKAHETCSGCNTARYCSSFCQHKDWENHHSMCGRNNPSSSHSERNSLPSETSKNSHHSTVSNAHTHESNSNSSPINVSNPSPENHSPCSNNN